MCRSVRPSDGDGREKKTLDLMEEKTPQLPVELGGGGELMTSNSQHKIIRATEEEEEKKKV